MTTSNLHKRLGLDVDQKIWDLANWRFLQCEAQFWQPKTKTLELVALICLAIFLYLFFFSEGSLTIVRNISAIVCLFLGLEVHDRKHEYDGYLNGYEQGFNDAARKHLGFREDESLDYEAVRETFVVIEESEQHLDDEDWKARQSQMQEGLSQASSFFRAWKTGRLPG